MRGITKVCVGIKGFNVTDYATSMLCVWLIRHLFLSITTGLRLRLPALEHVSPIFEAIEHGPTFTRLPFGWDMGDGRQAYGTARLLMNGTSLWY